VKAASEVYVLAAVYVFAAGGLAHADPFVLTANALATTTSPAGLITVSADAAMGTNVSAEAVVWTGGGGNLTGDRPGDVLVMALRARTDGGSASGQLGRFVAMLGALRPMQIDGAAGRVRLPYHLDLEAYAGVPVVAGLTTARTWDWITPPTRAAPIATPPRRTPGSRSARARSRPATRRAPAATCRTASARRRSSRARTAIAPGPCSRPRRIRAAPTVTSRTAIRSARARAATATWSVIRPRAPAWRAPAATRFTPHRSPGRSR